MTLRQAFSRIAIFLLACVAAWAQNNPVATIDAPLVPERAASGSAGFTLTIHGTGFISDSVVNWNGSPRATAYVSGSQVTATISASDVATAETANVTVVNPAPGGGISNTAYFEVTAGTSNPQFVVSDFAIGNDPGGAAVGDFNNDGKLDLAIVQSNPEMLLLYLGNGDGTFQPAITQEIGNDGSNAIATADFNHDGNLDLVTSNYNGTISVFLGNGNGTFQYQIDSPSGLASQGVAIGDFNGDGNVDVAVTSYPPPAVSVLLGKGDGTFQPAVGYPVKSAPVSLVAGDFNNDGKLDLTVSAKGHISVLLGNGDGTFQSELTTLSIPTGPVVAADFDGDGNLDLALGPASDHDLYIRLGKGDGTFNLPKKYKVNEEATSLTYGDFNGDGILDLAFGGGGGYIDVLLGKVGGTFGGAHMFNGNLYVAAGDFNNDGALDIGTNDGVFMATTADVSPTSLSFGSQLVGSSSKPMTVTLKNEGLSSLAISSIAVTSNFAETNTCGSSLAPLAGCKISVTFDPLMLGQLNGTLTITDGAFGSPQTVSLTGTGAAPAVTLNPTSLTFGAQPVGTTSSPQYVMLTNTGDAALTIASIVASGDFAQTNSCGTTVLPGQDCTLIVTFTPTQTGTRTGAITITDNALDSPETVPLTGTGD